MAKITKLKPNTSAELYNKLKYLNKFLFNPAKFNPDYIVEDSKLFDSNIKYRLYNNCLLLPKIIWYINKHLNDIYGFYSLDSKNLLYTFAEIFKISNIKDSSYLYFSKYQVFKRDQFSKLIDKHSEENNLTLNKNEIYNLYKLYELGLIDIELSKNIGKEDEVEIVEEPAVQIQTNKSPEIIQFINNLLNYKTKRKLCRECSSCNKPSSVLDTNLSDLSQRPIDLAIIANISPTDEDITNQTPLSSESGKLFRVELNKLVNKYNLKYIITNLSMCYSEDNNKKNIDNCKGIIDEILRIFNPRIILIFEDNRKLFGIKSPLKDSCNQIINGKYLCTPSDVDFVNGSNVIRSRYFSAFQTLDTFYNKSIGTNSTHNLEIYNNSETQNFELGDTLFNIEIFNDQIIYILIDKNGDKKYIVEKVVFPVYVKLGQYSECEYIQNIIDYQVDLTLKQKQQLSAKLNQYVNHT